MLSALIKKIHQNDPGWLRLKQATKTVAAILIVLVIFHQQKDLLPLAAALVTGFAMQSHQGFTRGDQMKTALFAYPLLILALTLGSFAKPYPLFAAILLVLLGFFAFYLQRFGPRFMIFPVFAWIVCFLGTIFPSQPFTQILQNMGAMAIGCLVTFLVYFFIWPRRPVKHFYRNLREYYTAYIKMLLWTLRFYNKQKRLSSSDFLKALPEHQAEFRQTILLNQAFYDAFNSNTALTDEKITELHLEQYTKAKSIGMIVESTQRLAQQHIILNDSLCDAILNLGKYYIGFFRSIHVNLNTFSITYHANLKELSSALDRLEEAIAQSDLFGTDEMIYLLNIHLGFKRLSKVYRERYED